MENSFSFPEGLLGLEDIKEYTFSPVEKDNTCFFWLKAKDSKNDLSFLLADPFAFFSDYEIDLPLQVQEKLAIEQKEDVAIYTIVTVPQSGFKEATTNLVGPVILNLKNKKAMQYILEKSNYTTKHFLFDQKRKAANG